MMLRFYDDGLSRDRQAQLYNFLSGPGWEYGAYSTPETRSSCYWYKHFGGFLGNETLDADKLPPVIGLFWTALTQEIFKGHTLVRCYANGYPYGAEGAVHTDISLDAPEGRFFTGLYYPHLRWDADWGGERLFFNAAKDDLIAAIYPKPGRLVLFDSLIPHVARPLTRKCPALRITLMFKTEIKS